MGMSCWEKKKKWGGKGWDRERQMGRETKPKDESKRCDMYTNNAPQPTHKNPGQDTFLDSEPRSLGEDSLSGPLFFPFFPFFRTPAACENIAQTLLLSTSFFSRKKEKRTIPRHLLHSFSPLLLFHKIPPSPNLPFPFPKFTCQPHHDFCKLPLN